MRHMFDGYGFLSRLQVQGGRAWGNQRYVQSKAYKAYTAQGMWPAASRLKLMQPSKVRPCRGGLRGPLAAFHAVLLSKLPSRSCSARLHSGVRCQLPAAVSVCCCFTRSAASLVATEGPSRRIWSPSGFPGCCMIITAGCCPFRLDPKLAERFNRRSMCVSAVCVTAGRVVLTEFATPPQGLLGYAQQVGCAVARCSDSYYVLRICCAGQVRPRWACCRSQCS